MGSNFTDHFNAWSTACSGVGVTKPIFSVPLFSQFFTMIKTLATCLIPHSYLTGVTAAELRRHLTNMNRDWKYVTYIFAIPEFSVTEKLTNGALVTPTPGWQHRKHKCTESLTLCEGKPLLVDSPYKGNDVIMESLRAMTLSWTYISEKCSFSFCIS